MKKSIILVALATLTLVACEKEEKYIPSTECKLSTFKVVSSTASVEGFIDQTAKTVELSCMPSEKESFTAATAEFTISDKATITPDPAEARDYTNPVTFTVTAEDGITTASYKVSIADAEFQLGISLANTTSFGAYGAKHIDGTDSGSQCGVSFSGLNLVFNDGTVGDLKGNKVGTLNKTGIPTDWIINSSSNDQNGIYAAVVNSKTDAAGALYAWLDGYDKAPTAIIPDLPYKGYFLSVSGDLKGEAIASISWGYMEDWRRGFNVYQLSNGSVTKTTADLAIPHAGNDGCWGTQLSFPTANPKDGVIAWDSVGYNTLCELNGSSSGQNIGGSSSFFVYPNLDQIVENQETCLMGTVSWAVNDAQPCYYCYGNYSTGHVRAFRYEGQNYAACVSASWDRIWLTVQKMDNRVSDDPNTDDDESLANYLLTTTQATDCPGQVYCCSAYVHDASTGEGHIIIAGYDAVIDHYIISTERL